MGADCTPLVDDPGTMFTKSLYYRGLSAGGLTRVHHAPIDEGDYGVRAMLDLAERYGQGPVQSEAIARRQGISTPTSTSC